MPNEPKPNQEWELHELIESLSAEFDRFQDTLQLKSYARGISFGLTTTHFELSVFSRYDPELKKWLFRTAMPGEAGASVVKLDIPPLLKSQVQTDGPAFDTMPDTRPVKELGFSKAEVERLGRLGIFNIDNLKKMSTNSEMRQMITNKTEIKPDRIAQLLNIPEIWYIMTENDTVTIIGDSLTAEPDKTVLIEGRVAEVTESSQNRLTARLPEGVVTGEIIISSHAGTSRYMAFDRNTQIETVPIKGYPAISKQHNIKLKEAGIVTVASLLTLPAARLAEILKVSKADAVRMIESVAAEARTKTKGSQ